VKDSVLEAVRETASENDCLIALGGGADSAVLVWAAVEALGPDRVNSVFVYHGLEGSDDLRDAALAVSSRVGVRCTVIERLVPDGGNLEARARAERYDAIEGVIDTGTLAFTAHTADDQAETVLMRLMRGSGTGALSGISYRRGVWRRPLLGISRGALRSIAVDLELPFSDDPANTDPRFLRARIRHVVMPAIEAECGPRTKDLIRKSSALLAADDDELEAVASKIPITSIARGVSMPLGPMIALSDPIASRVARRALREVFEGEPGSASDIDAVLSVVRGGDATTISGAFQVVREPPFVSIVGPGDETIPAELKIRVGDSFEWLGVEYSTRVTSRPPPSIAGGRFTLLSEQSVGTTMGVRAFHAGDRIEIDAGATPVKEVLRVSGVPERMRPYSPVTTVDGRIAAVIGMRVAAWARPAGDKAVVTIEREVNTWK
jgi:tRNA(Ile)-lysidine synthase